jgi:hypothetical protein
MAAPAPARRIVELATPEDHFRALASNQRHDHLLWAAGRKEKGEREWFRIAAERASDQLAAYHSQPDVFITPNEFYRWRLIRLLAGLNAFYVDIDVHDGSGCPVRAAWQAIDRVTAARVPSPNMVVYTGRGAHLYWLFGRTPAAALPRWQVAQRRLGQIAGADIQALDATRVLRLIGTQNSKADSSRRTVRAEVLNPERYQFDWLFDEIAEKPRAEVRDLRAARALKEARTPTAAESAQRSKRKGSIFQVWYHRYQDLIRISDAYWFGGVPPGHRNLMLFHMSLALSWFTRAEALVDEITHVARHHMPTYTDSEITSTVSGVVKRALEAADGKLRYWDGMQVDPRYRYRADSLWDIFGELVEGKPDLMPALRAILPADERRRRQAQLEEARNRVQEGRYKVQRGAYLQQAQTRKEEARKLRETGLRPSEIAAQLGIALRTAQLYLRDGQTAAGSAAGGGDPPEPLSRCAKSARLVFPDQPEESDGAMEPQAAVESAAVLGLKAQGLTVRQIAERTGFSKSKVGRLLKAPAATSIVPPTKSAPRLYGGLRRVATRCGTR